MAYGLKESPVAQHGKEHTYIESGGEGDPLLKVSLKKHIHSPQEDGQNPKDAKERVQADTPPQIRRCNMYPATTRVLLWTKALTGVGASIAMGNQKVKGNWALLVKEHMDRTNNHTLNRARLLEKRKHLTNRTNMKQSPNWLTRNTFMALSLPTLL